MTLPTWIFGFYIEFATGKSGLIFSKFPAVWPENRFKDATCGIGTSMEKNRSTSNILITILITHLIRVIRCHVITSY